MLSIIVTTHNQRALVVGSVRSVVEQACEEPFEVIVVDDGSTDGTADAVRETFGDQVTLIAKETAAGWPDSLRRGLTQAESDRIVVFDPHCEAPPGWLQTVSEHLTPETTILSGRCGHRKTFMHKLASVSLHADFMSPDPCEMRMFFDDNSAFQREVLEGLLAEMVTGPAIGDAVGLVLMSDVMRRQGIAPTHAPACLAWHYAPTYGAFLRLRWGETAECTMITRRLNRGLRGGWMLSAGPFAPFLFAGARYVVEVVSSFKSRRNAGLRWFEMPAIWAAAWVATWVYLAGLIRCYFRYRHIRREVSPCDDVRA